MGDKCIYGKTELQRIINPRLNSVVPKSSISPTTTGGCLSGLLKQDSILYTHSRGRMPGATMDSELPVEPQSLKKLSFKSMKRALDLFSPTHGQFPPPDPERF